MGINVIIVVCLLVILLLPSFADIQVYKKEANE